MGRKGPCHTQNWNFHFQPSIITMDQQRCSIMTVLHRAILLVALLGCGEAAPTREECEDLVKPLETSQLFKISGKWILIEAYCDDKMAGETLENSNSSWANYLPTAENKTFILEQGSMVHETCITYSLNMTVVNNTLVVNNSNDVNIASYLQTCPECLVVHDSVMSRGELVQYLLIYGKTGKLADSELARARMQAECLKFQQPPQFTYDGVAELCAPTECMEDNCKI